MSGLVGNPEDQFSRVAAHNVRGCENQKLITRTKMFNRISCHDCKINIINESVDHMTLDTSLTRG